MLSRMTTQLAIRFVDDDMRLVDEMVRTGVAANRSEVVRLAVHRLVSEERRHRAIEAEAARWAEFPQTSDEIERSRANAVEYCSAEDWSDVYPTTRASTSAAELS